MLKCGCFLIQKRFTVLNLCCVIAHASEHTLQLTCTLGCKDVTPRLVTTFYVGITTIASRRVGLDPSARFYWDFLLKTAVEPCSKVFVPLSLSADSFQWCLPRSELL